MRANEVEALQDTLGGGKVLDGPRSRRSAGSSKPVVRQAERPKYAEYGESDLEDEDEGDDEEDEVEVEGDDADVNDFDELGAEAEGGTDDEDVEMEDAPPPPFKQHVPPKAPKITLKASTKSTPKQAAKAKVVVTPASVGPLKSVEDQEMDEDPGDDEVSSELSEEDDEEPTTLNVEDDAEGEEDILDEEDVEGEDEELEDEEDVEADSDEETLGSGAATPDPTKLTKRQRGRPEDQGTLLALDMAPQQRKVRV